MRVSNPESKAVYQVQIDEQGRIILPAALRDDLGLQAGDPLTLIQTEDDLIVLPTRLILPELNQHFAQAMKDGGLKLDDLLSASQTEREQLFQERYGHLTNTD